MKLFASLSHAALQFLLHCDKTKRAREHRIPNFGISLGPKAVHSLAFTYHFNSWLPELTDFRLCDTYMFSISQLHPPVASCP